MPLRGRLDHRSPAGASTGLRPDEIVAAGIVHVPQGDLLFPEMTVLENLLMGAYLPEAARARAPRGWRRSSRCCRS